MTSMNELWAINSSMTSQMTAITKDYDSECSSHRQTKQELVRITQELKEMRQLCDTLEKPRRKTFFGRWKKN